MKISCIIPALNEQAAIEHSIAAAWLAGADEVIVVDGGSSDQTRTIAESLDCQLIDAPAGRASQMNAGAKLATGDVLLFVHADNALTDAACEQIRDALVVESTARRIIGWGGFQQRIDHQAKVYRWIECGNAWRVKHQGLVYGDQGLFVSRTLFEQVGGFPCIALMEDFELSERLSRLQSPRLLPGPIRVSARRWQARGVVRQTLRNWSISTAYRWGVSPQRLAKWYERS